MFICKKTNNLKNKKKNKKKFSIGIDLGTTYSLVATYYKEKITILNTKFKKKLLPSVIYYGKNYIKIGKSAIPYITSDTKNTITSIKRLMGLSLSMIKNLYPNIPYIIEENKNSEVVIKTQQGTFFPYQISSLILKKLINQVQKNYNKKIDYAVITVPAYFDEIQRQETKKAVMLTGLKNFRLLNEPTAAAIAYGFQNEKTGIIAIYDLGGGTFDFSLLKLNYDVFEVLATNGNSSLGGDDFDQLLYSYIISKLKLLKNNLSTLDKQKIYKLAKQIKKKLSIENSVFFSFNDICNQITREEFNTLIIPLINKTINSCDNAIQDANIDIQEINKVILVGGSTRIPIIQKKVHDFFQKKPLTNINPDEAVALGAAIQANNLITNNKKHKILLLDVLPLSLGIEVIGGIVEKIITRNSKIPISRTKVFTTYQDNQTAINIHIVQGERELVKHCKSLKHFVLKGILPKPAGKNKIFVTFEINTDGLLHITATDEHTKVQNNITINNTLNINNYEIKNFIKDFEKNATKDTEKKEKIENNLKKTAILKIIQSNFKKNND